MYVWSYIVQALPSIIACSLVVAVIVIFWRSSSEKSNNKKNCSRNKSKLQKNQDNLQKSSVNEKSKEVDMNSTIPDLPEPRWVKVGNVKELYIYPLKSGKGRDIQECEFTAYGLRAKEDGKLALRDRMFLVYKEEINNNFQTAKKYPSLLLVNVTAVDESTVKLETEGMSAVTINIFDDDSLKLVECKIYGETIQCLDCGDTVAKWLSNFLIGEDSGMRLGYSTDVKRNISEGIWKHFTTVYHTLRKEDMGLFADLASYMLLTSQSLEELNKRLEKPVPNIQFRPNIVVSTDEPFAEDKWEWIKIGDTVIRNVKPCPRCKVITCNPETGMVDSEEPLKILKTFRSQTDPHRILVDGKAPIFGIYCGLYVEGYVKVGDEVFVHIPEDSSDELDVLN